MPPENENKVNIDNRRRKRSNNKRINGCCIPTGQCFYLSHSSRCYFIDEIPTGWESYPYVLKGYRINLGWSGSFASIFKTCHNEFYYIWTDIIPLLIYITIVTWHINTSYFINSDYKLKLVESGLFAGVIFCRGTSTFYHIFNCVNLWTSQHLIQIDLIGIACCFTLTCPYFYIIGCTNSREIIFDENFKRYCSILFLLQAICTVLFTSNMICGVTRIALNLEQPLLCIVAACGNFSGIRIFMNSSEVRLKCHLAVAMTAQVFGYICNINVYQ